MHVALILVLCQRHVKKATKNKNLTRVCNVFSLVFLLGRHVYCIDRLYIYIYKQLAGTQDPGYSLSDA